ncbi:hypothetical protein [Rhodoblastus sp.]|uniref:hypothetical protein n=1 Tax=Rhodoblastus sp. TaxID=1962975 RepID=UPI0035B0C351
MTRERSLPTENICAKTPAGRGLHKQQRFALLIGAQERIGRRGNFTSIYQRVSYLPATAVYHCYDLLSRALLPLTGDKSPSADFEKVVEMAVAFSEFLARARLRAAPTSVLNILAGVRGARRHQTHPSSSMAELKRW